MFIFDNHDPSDEFDGDTDDIWDDDPNYDPEPPYDDGPQLADDDIGSAEYDDFFDYPDDTGATEASLAVNDDDFWNYPIDGGDG